MTRVVNLFGGPGCGKSTTAAGLFHQMKLISGVKVELVTEFAKDLTYDKNESVRANQMAVVGEQFHRMWRLRDHVDWIITDSPLLLSWVYAKPPFNQPWFLSTVTGAFSCFNNINYVLRRKKEYSGVGREQTLAQAEGIDSKVENFLKGFGYDYLETDGNEQAPKMILDHLHTLGLAKIENFNEVDLERSPTVYGSIGLGK